ncbi:uncharacterized protein LOC106936742 [Poecilia latipinna]|uniref:uncharacterized protein LOC106936742 n=1 Tax=Poecilia latipinna TaxID=48699 RepID=UPI00072E485B|nr:PREDICTED: uncharacterized protein LOC106936742 [Poecilia latipinna]
MEVENHQTCPESHSGPRNKRAAPQTVNTKLTRHTSLSSKYCSAQLELIRLIGQGWLLLTDLNPHAVTVSLLLFTMMTSQVLLGVSLFLWLILDVRGFSVKGLQSPHKRSGGTTAEGNVASRRAGSGSSDPAGVSMQQPQSVRPVFVGVSTMPAAGYAAGSIPAGYYSGASYIPGSAAGSTQAAAGQASLPEARWTIAPQASNAQPQGSSALLPPHPPPGPPLMTLQSGETSNVVKEAELGSYQQQMAEFGYPAGHMGPGQSLPLVATPSLGVGGLWGYSSPYPHPYSYPYPYFDYRLLYGLYPPGTYTTFSRNLEKGTDYYRPATIRTNMALMLHKCPRILELASRRSNQMRS